MLSETMVISTTISDPLPSADSIEASGTDVNSQKQTPEDLAAHLAHLVASIADVEELSRRAREAAANDLAQYEALVASCTEYRAGLEQACAIRDQAAGVREHAFGGDNEVWRPNLSVGPP